MPPTRKNAPPPAVKQDPYFKKTLSFEQSGARLELRVSQDLFSSFDVDVGTRFLLRTLNPASIGGLRSILDLGCGYGPIGLTLRKLAGQATVHMVDRDALAVEYSRQNAALNRLDDVQIYGSLGYDDVERRDFDLIVSNIPAKAGDVAITHFLQEATSYLSPQGSVAVVVVTPLEPLVDRVLGGMSNVEVMLRRQRPGHTVYQYRFTDQAGMAAIDPLGGFERGLYGRGSAQLELGRARLALETAYGLPEFESPSHTTEMLIDSIQQVNRAGTAHAVMLNPGQGYGAVALCQRLRPQTLDLVDRDLLALRYSRRNLINSGYASEQVAIMHQVGLSNLPSRPADVVAGVLREDEGPAALSWTLDRIAESLAPGATVVLASSSTAISRLVTVLQSHKQLVIEDRRRHGGNSLLVLQARH